MRPDKRRYGSRYSTERPRNRQIAVFGSFCVGNMGNDESCRSMVRLLRQRHPDASVTAISRSTFGAEETLGIRMIRFTSPRVKHTRGISLYADRLGDFVRVLRIIDDFDEVVVPGTGILEPTRATIVGGDLLWHLYLAVACRIRRVPLSWFAVGGGASLPTLQRMAARTAARLTRYRSFRDPVTVQSLGFSNVESVVPDICFGAGTRAARPLVETKRVVAVAVFDYDPSTTPEFESYIEHMVEICRILERSGVRVAFFVGDSADVRLADEVRRRAGTTPTTAETIRPGSFDELVASLADCTVVVASRYHVLAAAAVASRPMIALAHASKDTALMEILDLDEFCVPISQTDPDHVCRLVHRAFENAASISGRLHGRMGELQEDVLAEFDRSRIGDGPVGRW